MQEKHHRKRTHSEIMNETFMEKMLNDIKMIYYSQSHQVKWKNERPKCQKAYEPTEIEHIANIISHGILIIPSIYASLILLSKSQNSYDHMQVALIYGAALVLLFSVSFLYHCVFYSNRNQFLKDLLHRMDRAMIYIFIAGSYYPWLILEHSDYPKIVTVLKWLVWILAALGILYQQIFHERYKSIETIFYILIGVVPALIVVLCGHEFAAMSELKLGGVIYIIGVFFFKSDGRLCCAHCVWHTLVGLAAYVHYFAILKHLYSEQCVHEHINLSRHSKT